MHLQARTGSSRQALRKATPGCWTWRLLLLLLVLLRMLLGRILVGLRQLCKQPLEADERAIPGRAISHSPEKLLAPLLPHQLAGLPPLAECRLPGFR